MKFSEFAALCRSEWLAETHGDVCGLSLTEDSLIELTVDVAAGENIHAAGTGDGAAGLLLSELVNPVTRAAVKIVKGKHYDTYQVSRALPRLVLR